MTVMRVERVVYGVSDLEECTRFFADFGLEPVDGGGNGNETQVARFATPVGQVVELRAARAIEAAGAAFRGWRDAGPEARSAILLRASGLIHQRAADIGRVMTLEEGKPLPEATGEVHRAATLLAWDCEEGRRAYGRMHEAVHRTR